MLTDWTIRLIVLNAKLSGRNTYIDIMDYCFGRQGRIAVSLFQGAFAFGGMCAFIVVIGDTLPHVLTSVIPALEGSFLASRGFIMIVCTMSISFPLSLYRSIESLSRASAIALVSMVLIIITVIVRGPAMPESLKGDPSLRLTVINPSQVVRSIAVISFAFVCHHNSLLIYGSLKEPSMDRFGKVTHYSTAIAAAALVSMSLAGYMTFTDKTVGNVLNNFPPDDTMVNIARFCFGMNMLTTWPLELFVAREVVETYFYNGVYDPKRHIVITCALTLASLTVSLLATDLGVVLEVTGGLSATALAFIFPSICYLKLCGQEASSSSVTENREEGRDTRHTNGYSHTANEEEEDEDGEHSALHREMNGDISVDDVELPLRPGAQIRRRQPSLSGKDTPWYLTTKPLAVACTAFGCFVLVVSTLTTISDAIFGSSAPAIPAPEALAVESGSVLGNVTSSLSAVLGQSTAPVV
jgi:sodium-coupled neutral amino acid transporter 11